MITILALRTLQEILRKSVRVSQPGIRAHQDSLLLVLRPVIGVAVKCPLAHTVSRISCFCLAAHRFVCGFPQG